MRHLVLFSRGVICAALFVVHLLFFAAASVAQSVSHLLDVASLAAADTPTEGAGVFLVRRFQLNRSETVAKFEQDNALVLDRLKKRLEKNVVAKKNTQAEMETQFAEAANQLRSRKPSDGSSLSIDEVIIKGRQFRVRKWPLADSDTQQGSLTERSASIKFDLGAPWETEMICDGVSAQFSRSDNGRIPFVQRIAMENVDTSGFISFGRELKQFAPVLQDRVAGGAIADVQYVDQDGEQVCILSIGASDGVGQYHRVSILPSKGYLLKELYAQFLGVPTLVIQNDQFSKIDGFWAVGLNVIEQYGIERSSKRNELRTRTETLSIGATSFSAADVAFSLDVPEGTLLNDLSTDADKLTLVGVSAGETIPPTPTATGSSKFFVILVVNFAALLIVGFVYLAKKWYGRRRKT